MTTISGKSVTDNNIRNSYDCDTHSVAIFAFMEIKML